MKKLQQYWVFKLSTKRIIKNNYKISLSIEEARKNGELISISHNQVISSIYRINKKIFDKDYLDILTANRKNIRKLDSCIENIEELKNIEIAINNILFIPELISLTVTHKKQYNKIIKNGFEVNGIEYARLLCGAGHSRRNTVIFCAKHIEVPLKEMLNNGRKMNDMVLAKNNAYFALSYSGVLPVSQPYFCVVPDCETTRNTEVEYIDKNNNISTKSRDILFNLFDGQGLISPSMAKKWAKDLHLDYIPSSFIIRNSFLKGMVCVFDFHKFSEEVAEKHIIKDAWGDNVNIRDMDLVLTTSQFKAWKSYDSLREYEKNCLENGFSFGVVRSAPEKDNTSVTTNYQFLQVLDLNNEQIESLCSRTIEFFDKTINSDWIFAVLYLMGKLANVEYNETLFESINDPITKAIILNNELINDSYIKGYLSKSLNKKIKESYVGNLILDGNYNFIVQDPMAFCEYIFGLPFKGLLSKNQHYSGFWNKKNVDKVAAMRAPLTWKSEVNILNLVDNKQTDKWYKHLQTGCIIHTVHGVDMMLCADADADGDLIMTSNQEEIISGAIGGLPVEYARDIAEKEFVVENLLWNIDLFGFDGKIGFITNLSTTLFTMQAKYDIKSKEYVEIEKRLKLCRKYQGLQIDHAKGLEVETVPTYWTKYTKITNDMSQEKIDETNFNNSIRIKKRPYFFRYRYSDYNKRYKNYNNTYENFCQTNLGKSLEETLKNPETEEENNIIEKYHKYSPLLDSNCIMNCISHHMEKNVKIIKYDMRKKTKEDHSYLLKTKYIETDETKLKKIILLHKEFKAGKRTFANARNKDGKRIYNTAEQYCKYIRSKAFMISGNAQELANLAVDVCYKINSSDSKSFVWSVFEEGVLQNILENKQKECFIPLINESGGDISYLGKRYSLQKIDIEKKASNFDY